MEPELPYSEFRFSSQIGFACLSFVGSVLLGTMIARSEKKFTSPYHRIMFGLGVCDILQSIAVIAGPFSSPKDSLYAIWAIGNVYTCNVTGFFIMFGNISCPLYLLLLCCHLYCRINKRMTSAKFSKIEWIGHCIILVYASVACIWAMAAEVLNSLRGGICYIAISPPECGLDTEYSQLVVGECTRGLTAANFFWIPVVTSLFCLVCSKVILCAVFLYFRDTQRMFHNVRNTISNTMERDSIESDVNGGIDTEVRVRMWRREAKIQAILYVLMLTFTYLPATMFQLERYTKVQFPTAVKIIFSAVLYPLKGFFNLCIFIGPKVTHFRLKYPECSRIKAFLLIIKAGGKIPDEIYHGEIRLLGCCKLEYLCYCCICLRSEYYDGISDISSRPSDADTHVSSNTRSNHISSFLTSLFVVKKSVNGTTGHQLPIVSQEE